MSEKKPAETTEKKKLHKLLRQQNIKLYDILREWKNELHSIRPSYDDVAKQATTALGFPVTRSHVFRAVCDLEIRWKQKIVRGTASGGVRMRNENIYRRVRTLEYQLKALATRLGEELPQPPSPAPRAAESGGPG